PPFDGGGRLCTWRDPLCRGAGRGATREVIMPGISSSLSTRILFYADYSGTHLLPVPPGVRQLRNTPMEFGLSILKDILEASSFPHVSVHLVNRFWDLDETGDIPIGTSRKSEPTRLNNTTRC